MRGTTGWLTILALLVVIVGGGIYAGTSLGLIKPMSITGGTQPGTTFSVSGTQPQTGGSQACYSNTGTSNVTLVAYQPSGSNITGAYAPAVTAKLFPKVESSGAYFDGNNLGTGTTSAGASASPVAIGLANCFTSPVVLVEGGNNVTGGVYPVDKITLGTSSVSVTQANIAPANLYWRDSALANITSNGGVAGGSNIINSTIQAMSKGVASTFVLEFSPAADSAVGNPDDGLYISVDVGNNSVYNALTDVQLTALTNSNHPLVNVPANTYNINIAHPLAKVYKWDAVSAQPIPGKNTIVGAQQRLQLTLTASVGEPGLPNVVRVDLLTSGLYLDRDGYWKTGIYDQNGALKISGANYAQLQAS